MSSRFVMAASAVLLAWPAAAEPLSADAAHRFVVGKTFAYSCFDGTRGSGRIQSDLSVAGTIQVKGSGPERFVRLPPGTLRVKGGSVCAAVRGIPFEPCFLVDRTDARSFRGSVSGMRFAYCDFTRTVPRRPTVRTTWRERVPPQSLAAHAVATPQAGN